MLCFCACEADTEISGDHRSRSGRALKDRRDGIINPFEPNELQLIAGAERNLVEVAAISRGQHNPGQASGCRRDNFFLDAADRKHQASQRNLTGHGSVASDCAIREQGGESCEHRDTSAWAILWRGTRRDVDMDVALL